MTTAATSRPVPGEDRPILHLVRIVLEASSPLSIGGGEDSSIFDTALLRDANGLPTLQGASLAGNLRHRVSDEPDGLELTRELFGFEEEGEAKGSPARLTFSFGSVLGADGHAVQGLRDEQSPLDEVLAILMHCAPLRRDHVAIDRRGVADDRTKHDRSAVPQGTRFAVELAMWGRVAAREADKEKLARLVGIMSDPAFRLGGATRRGYGQIKIERSYWRAIDIVGEGPATVRQVRAAGPSNIDGFSKLEGIEPTNALSSTSGVIVLRPVGVWRIGQGDVALFHRTGEDKKADALPLTEPIIVWNKDDTGSVQAAAAEVGDPGKVRLSVPASAVKGPLAHRTLYHYHRLNSQMIAFDDKTGAPTNREFAGVQGKEGISKVIDDLFGRETLSPLLGNAKSRDEGGGRDDVGVRGQAGLLLIDDSEVRISRTQIVHIMHNSIDRFTGGVRGGLLFSEEAVLGGELRIKIRLLRGPVPPEIKQAFCLALKDLCEGRIAIGAKRLGFAGGHVEWEGADWIADITASDRPPVQSRNVLEAAQ